MAKADAMRVDLYFIWRKPMRRKSTYILCGESWCDEGRLIYFMAKAGATNVDFIYFMAKAGVL